MRNDVPLPPTRDAAGGRHPAARIDDPPLEPRDLTASLAAARQLGPDYDEAIAASLADRLAEAVDRHARDRLARERAATRSVPLPPPQLNPSLAVTSLFAAMGLVPIAQHTAGAVGVVAVVVLLVTLNLGYFYFATRR